MPLSDYDPIFQAAGAEWGIDPTILKAVAAQESQGNPRAVSKAGAQGIMGIMPGTQRDLGITDPYNVTQSIYGGAKYLAQAQAAEPTSREALLYYHGGPDWRQKFGPESQGYVAAVTKHYQAFAQVAPTAVPPVLPAGGPTSAMPVSSALSDSDFLAQTGAANPKKGAPLSDDDFLKLSGAAPKETESVKGFQPVEPEIIGPGNPTFDRIVNAGVQGFQDTPRILTPQAEAAANQNPVGRFITVPLMKIAGAIPAGYNALASGAAQAANELSGDPRLGRDVYAGVQIAPLFMGGGRGQPGPEGPGMPRFVQEHYGEGMQGNPLYAPPPPALPAPNLRPPPFVPPGTPTPLLPRILNLLRADEQIATTRPAEIPPTATTTPTGDVVPIVQPRNPLEAPATPAPGNTLAVNPDGSPMTAEQQAAARTAGEGPQSVGAAASRENTPASIIGLTPQEEQAYRSTAEGQKLIEPQPIGTPDRRQLVDGVNPNLAEQEQTVNTARELKALNIRSEDVSQEAKQIAQEHNDARTAYLQNTVRSPVDIMREEAAQQADIEAAKPKVFGHGGPDADVQPIVEHMQSVLSKPVNRQNTALQTVYAPIMRRLVNEDGTPKITDPEELWGLRRDIDRMASKRYTADDPNLHAVAHDLNELSGEIDKQISAVRPGYDDMLATYADHARKIDAMRVLQGHENGLYLSSGGQMRMSFDKFQRMMRNIVDMRATGPTDLNPYKSIPQETMDRLWNLRDDLRRSASAMELAKTAGSDTVQNVWDMIKGLATGSEAQTALHAFAASHLGLPGYVGVKAASAILSPILSGRRAMRDTRRGMEMLYPPNQLQAPPSPNLLQGPSAQP